MTAVTYTSNLVAKGGRMRGLYEGQPQKYMARFFLADGTVLNVGDIFLAVPLGENMSVLSVSSLELGDVDVAAGKFGYYQILDSAGDPVEVQRNGPRGDADTKFASPATSDAAYLGATALEGYLETGVGGNSLKLAGPANFGMKITTGATVNGDTELFIGCVIVGETSQASVVGSAAPSGDVNDYLLD